MTEPDPVPKFFRSGIIYRQFRHHEAMDGVLLGWVPTNALEGTSHGLYSVLMMWLCECPLRVPLRGDA